MSQVEYLNGFTTTGWWFWIFVCLRIIQSGLCFFGNLLILIAIVKFVSLHKPANVLIAGLASADFLSSFIILKYFILNYSTQGKAFSALCKIIETIALSCAVANTHSIMLISVERLIFISFPLQYNLWVTAASTVKAVITMWVFTLFLAILVRVFGVPTHPGQVCRFVIYYKPEVYGILVGYFCVLTLIVIINYIIIGVIVYRQRKSILKQIMPAPLKPVPVKVIVKPVTNTESDPIPSTSTTELERPKKAPKKRQASFTKMMVMVLGVYVLSTSPQIICSLMFREVHAQTTTLMYALDWLATLAWWCQSFLNPVIYAWKSQEFNTAFRRLFRMKINQIQPYLL